MPPLARAVGLLCGVLALTVLLWFGRYSPLVTLSQERLKAEEERAWAIQKSHLQEIADDLKKTERSHQQQEEIERQRAEIELLEDQHPPIVNRPPFPMLVLDGNPFDLGTDRVGETVRHTFTIKNDGEGPLIIYRPQYTSGKVNRATPSRQTIPPGGAANVDITFRAMEPTSDFAKTTQIWTNDPAQPQVVLKIHAKIAARDAALPPKAADRADEVKVQIRWHPTETAGREYRRPPIADKPPFPKIVVDRNDCDLGIVDSDQTVRNTFKITNVGPARLVLVWHPTYCTHSSAPAFPRYQEIEPGKSLDIEITCSLYDGNRDFRKVLSFWTNDPTQPDLDLSIGGSAVDAKR